MRVLARMPMASLAFSIILCLGAQGARIGTLEQGQVAGLEPFSYDQLQPMTADHSASYRPFGWRGDGSDSMTTNRPPTNIVAFPFQAPSLPADFQQDMQQHHASDLATNPRFREVFPQALAQPLAQPQPQQRVAVPGAAVPGVVMASDPAVGGGVYGRRPLTPATAQAKFLEERAYAYQPAPATATVPLNTESHIDIPTEAPDMGDSSAAKLAPLGEAEPRATPLVPLNRIHAGELRLRERPAPEKKKEEEVEEEEGDGKQEKEEGGEDDKDGGEEDKEMEKEDEEAANKVPPPPDSDGEEDDASDSDSSSEADAGGEGKTKPTPLVDLPSKEESDGPVSAPAAVHGPLHKCNRGHGEDCTVAFDSNSINWSVKTVPTGSLGGPSTANHGAHGKNNNSPLDAVAPGLSLLTGGPAATSGPIKAAQEKLSETRKELVNDIRWVQQVQQIVLEYKHKMEAVKRNNVLKAREIKNLAGRIELMRKKDKEARLEKELHAALGALKKLEGTSQSLNNKIETLTQTKTGLKHTINKIQSVLGRNIVDPRELQDGKGAQMRFREKISANEGAKALFSGLMRFLETSAKATKTDANQLQGQHQGQRIAASEGVTVTEDLGRPLGRFERVEQELSHKIGKVPDPLVVNALVHGDLVKEGVRALRKRREMDESLKVAAIMNKYK